MNRKNFRHGNFHRKPKIQEKCSKCFKEIIYCLLHGCMINGHPQILYHKLFTHTKMFPPAKGFRRKKITNFPAETEFSVITLAISHLGRK